jgi:hypothetical protein
MTRIPKKAKALKIATKEETAARAIKATEISRRPPGKMALIEDS